MDNIFSTIREHMPVLDASGEQVGTVDRLEDEELKLTRDDVGRHHWIDLGMIAFVDENVHLKAVRNEVERQWREERPSL